MVEMRAWYDRIGLPTALGVGDSTNFELKYLGLLIYYISPILGTIIYDMIIIKLVFYTLTF
jgi:hypothetical protein